MYGGISANEAKSVSLYLMPVDFEVKQTVVYKYKWNENKRVFGGKSVAQMQCNFYKALSVYGTTDMDGGNFDFVFFLLSMCVSKFFQFTDFFCSLKTITCTGVGVYLVASIG